MSVYPEARPVGAVDRAGEDRGPDVDGFLDRWIASGLRRRLDGLPVRLRLWNGAEIALSSAAPTTTLVVRDRRTLFDLLREPELGFGEGYMSGRLEVQGDLVSLLETINRALPSTPFWTGGTWRRWFPVRLNTLRASRANVHHHYDIGNDFYRLWLDREMVYTCAYFRSPEQTLEDAQRAKMDHVCRKLRLQPGERVVEAGCGWGALALHMARHYGVSVTAFNISREQVRYARARAEAEGLRDRVEFVDADYRRIQGTFDAFVSVGMLEHVGSGHFRTLGEVIDRSLDRERGRGLLHFIGRNRPRPLSAWIRKRIFPGAYPPTLREVMHDVLEPWDLSVLDVENLRLHYAQTLRHWLARFERAAEQISSAFDPSFARAWRLYLAGSLATFTTGFTQLFQVTFARPRDNEIPWTRAELYR